jgi:hypothetical protein
MRKYALWIALAAALLVVAAIIARNSVQSPMLPRASEAWSRGRIVGHMAVKRPVALRLAPDGGVFLVWPNTDGKLELAHLGVDGQVLSDRVVPVRARKARDPQLQVGQDGRLHLLWREQEGQYAGIHYALLQGDGTPVGQPRQVSDPATRVSETPQLAVDAKGRLHALWTDDDGVEWALLDEAGETLAGPALLIPEADTPLVRVDAGGRVHLIWQRQVESAVLYVYYAVLDPDTGELGDPQEIAEVQVGGPIQMQGTTLGLGQDVGYVLWSEYDSRFYRYFFRCASFPLDAPEERRVTEWELRKGAGPEYLESLDGQRSPLPVALTEMMTGPDGQVALQVSLIRVGGSSVEEEVVTASTQASMRPVLIADDRAHLHMAWLETGGFGEYQVVYASTGPEVMRNYNALTFVDIVDGALDNVFRLSTVIVSLVGSLAIWALIPLLGLVIYHLVTSEELLETARARIAVGVVLAVEVALTFVVPPRIGVDIEWQALRWLIPAASAMVTTALVVNVVRRQQETHLFGLFFLFTIVNSVLQIVLFLLF